MELKDLLKELQKHIDTRMDEFAALGTKCKKVQREVYELQEKMSKIFKSLEAVHPIIIKQHPDKKELFEGLMEPYKKEHS